MKQGQEYERIEKALHAIEDYIKEGRPEPTLEALAHACGMRPTHFQKVFTAWVGVSPKQFMQYLKLERTKKLLGEEKLPLMKTAYRSGLSGTGRLHDLFVRIERMTPGEYAHGGRHLTISWGFGTSRFGRYIIASTERGVCWLRFITTTETEEEALLKAQWPEAQFVKREVAFHRDVRNFLALVRKSKIPLTLHLRGTPFQVKVWEALLRIPEGKLVAYGTVAKAAGKPKAVRAAASAVGDNPICYVIPCHRVIRSTGAIGNYSGGVGRKVALIGFEAAHA